MAIRRGQHRQPRPTGCRHQGQAPGARIVLITHLMEGIGIAIDFKGGRMFLTDLAGSVYSARLDGSEKQTLLAPKAISLASHTWNTARGVSAK